PPAERPECPHEEESRRRTWRSRRNASNRSHRSRADGARLSATSDGFAACAALIHRDCVALNFAILAINAYGIFRSIGNRRLPFSPAYGATAFSSAASPFTGG